MLAVILLCVLFSITLAIGINNTVFENLSSNFFFKYRNVSISEDSSFGH